MVSIILLIDFAITSASSLVSFIIIAAYSYDKELRRMPSNAFLISFVVTNLLVSSAGLILSSIAKSTDYSEEPSKFLLYSSYFVLSIVSYTLSLMVVSLDRYWAVVKPFSYVANMTWSLVQKILSVFWLGVIIFGIVTTTVAFVAWKEKELISTILLVFMLLVALLGLSTLVLVNSIILRQVRRQVRLLRSSSVERGVEVRRHLAKRESRTAYLCLGIVATFLCCWLPNGVCIVALLTGLRLTGWRHFMRISTTLYFVCLVVNPFWYIFWKRDFRQSLRRLFIHILCYCTSKSCVVKRNNVISTQNIEQQVKNDCRQEDVFRIERKKPFCQ